MSVFLVYFATFITSEIVQSAIWQDDMHQKNWDTNWQNNNIDLASDYSNDPPNCPDNIDCWEIWRENGNGYIYRIEDTRNYINIFFTFSYEIKSEGNNEWCKWSYNIDTTNDNNWETFYNATSGSEIDHIEYLPASTWNKQYVGIKVLTNINSCNNCGCYISHHSLDGILTQNPTTATPTTIMPTTNIPTTAAPTAPTTSNPTTYVPTTAYPTTSNPTTAVPTTAYPTTAKPTTSYPTTSAPTTAVPTTANPTSAELNTNTITPTGTPIEDGMIVDVEVTLATRVQVFDDSKSDNHDRQLNILQESPWLLISVGLFAIVLCLVCGIVICRCRSKKSNNQHNVKETVVRREMANNIQMTSSNSELQYSDAEFGRIKSVSNGITGADTVDGDDMITPMFPVNKYIENDTQEFVVDDNDNDIVTPKLFANQHLVNNANDEFVVGSDDDDNIMTPSGENNILGNDNENEDHTEGDDDDNIMIDSINMITDMGDEGDKEDNIMDAFTIN